MVSRLTIEYFGRDFVGWAAQPGLRSVQGTLEAVLDRLLGAPAAGPDGGRMRRLSVAGRTDRGVHAWGQVASYAGPPLAVAQLNALLPADVSVLDCARAPDGFDARSGALSRTYCFRLLARREQPRLSAGRVLWWPRALDRDLLNACAGASMGAHDFTAFTPTVTEHVHFKREVLRCEWQECGDMLELWIEADRFMRHMNRVLLGTMLEVAGGRRSLASFQELLDGAPRSSAGPTAPACGLALASVRYGEPAERVGGRRVETGAGLGVA